MPPAAALVVLPRRPGWLDQQCRRHTGARGHVIFGWPANTEADHENPGGRGLGNAVNGDSIGC